MSKAVKGVMIREIRARVGDHQDLLVVNTSRLDALTDNRLRLSLREKGIGLLQVKNSLAHEHWKTPTSLSTIAWKVRPR